MLRTAPLAAEAANVAKEFLCSPSPRSRQDYLRLQRSLEEARRELLGAVGVLATLEAALSARPATVSSAPLDRGGQAGCEPRMATSLPWDDNPFWYTSMVAGDASAMRSAENMGSVADDDRVPRCPELSHEAPSICVPWTVAPGTAVRVTAAPVPWAAAAAASPLLRRACSSRQQLSPPPGVAVAEPEPPPAPVPLPQRPRSRSGSTGPPSMGGGRAAARAAARLAARTATRTQVPLRGGREAAPPHSGPPWKPPPSSLAAPLGLGGGIRRRQSGQNAALLSASHV
eukprot:CAMPEP_0180676832 /NCGR_PEP_ID=MMETSP1037_2-20121125/67530_1 /TAXON_ID=632150 /ORGANISM="Azadinium spinosum, Strain 3D9" /LENGTH=285 /DNA_ID=CAMNT_0022706377 /DNA_START=8 /DNA_END=862 /DNA_ORIENTATION=-